MINNLSFAILVKNSSNTIEKALNSINNIAEEIVVLDTGSSDNTLEICNKYTDKIFKTEWENNFSLARNQLIRKCNTDWIFMIDSDEELKKTSINNLENLFSKIDNNIIYAPKIIDIYKNKQDIRYISKIIRNNVKFIGYLHEYPSSSSSFKIINIDNIEIIHYGYLNYEYAKSKRNIEISELSIKNTDNKIELIKEYSYLIIENLRISNYIKAKEIILDFLKLLDKLDKLSVFSIKIVHLFFTISIKSFISNDLEFAKYLILKALEFYPNSEEILSLKSSIQKYHKL